MKRTWLVLTFSSALLSACGSVPETHYYVLATTPSLDGVHPEVDPSLTVGVETFTVDPPYDQGLLVYRFAAHSVEVGFYDHHRWASPLGSLAAAVFANGSVGTNRGNDAEAPSTDVAFEPATTEGDYAAVLNGRVVYFEEVDYPDGQVVRIALDLSLAGPAGEPLWQRTLASETKIQASDASEVIEQLRVDFQGLVRKARDEIAAALDASRP